MIEKANDTLDVLFKYWNDEISEDELDKVFDSPSKPHGELLSVRQEAYHDIYVYEDGFEERDYIGD